MSHWMTTFTTKNKGAWIICGSGLRSLGPEGPEDFPVKRGLSPLHTHQVSVAKRQKANAHFRSHGPRELHAQGSFDGVHSEASVGAGSSGGVGDIGSAGTTVWGEGASPVALLGLSEVRSFAINVFTEAMEPSLARIRRLAFATSNEE